MSKAWLWMRRALLAISGWIRRTLLAISGWGLDGADVVGLAAFLMIFMGVRGLAGVDWALLAIGLPFAALYLRRELAEPRARGRRG